MGVFLLSCVACAGAPVEEQDADEVRRERLKDPANAWPMFQEQMRAGEYSQAHRLITPVDFLQYEVFFIVFASYEAPRRLVAKLVQHKVEAGTATGKILLCSAEFGVSREIRLKKFMGKAWTLEFIRDDIEFFKGRTLAWYRHQVDRADGWHFAYPPDWTYAPQWRNCACGK